MHKERFEIHIPDETLTDLRDRLARTRWPGDFANEGWAYGTEQGYLSELVRYWQVHFDWRVQERAINAFSHFRTQLEGVPVHFIHEKGKGPNPLPLILTHGWPWTFWDLNKVIRPLTNPAAFGGDPRDAFDVVVPSLPGFGFSTPLTKTGWNYWNTADLWSRLMREVLGYERYGAHGGDWGSAVTTQLGHKYPEQLIGIHLTMLLPLAVLTEGFPSPSEYTAEEQAGLQRFQAYQREGSGYSNIQMTRPQTLTYAMNDSPVGMCSWILEKRRDWSDSGGNVEKVFSKDELLTTMTLYWATQSFGTAARYYYEAAHNPWKPSHSRTPVVEVPTAVAALPKEIIQMPKRWAERYFNLQRWTPFPEGGHFAPMEQPERLVEDLRAFFRPLRGEESPR
ncbi:epoxide hydrolase family protein [Hyalangium rubrum]|uniref:Epoxide hydrolase n=1 Tax=Hyalangium rubrum TaxID=3103134 RepID=A0ABU5GX87_9BACT|nr:epoxide hydrolase [Hyalangium sp. s54d21]MDY7225701.1 epoxide hydrolase [Hyalangium sp. s54d21]